jgi:hypothetical protein
MASPFWRFNCARLFTSPILQTIQTYTFKKRRLQIHVTRTISLAHLQTAHPYQRIDPFVTPFPDKAGSYFIEEIVQNLHHTKSLVATPAIGSSVLKPQSHPPSVIPILHTQQPHVSTDPSTKITSHTASLVCAPARLRKRQVRPEVPHLHLLERKYLSPALLQHDLTHLVLQAAQDRPVARDRPGGLVRAATAHAVEPVHFGGARLVKTVVQAVICKNWKNELCF